MPLKVLSGPTKNGKIQFDRFNTTNVASEDFIIVERDDIDFQVDVAAKEAVNNYGVYYNYSPQSDYYQNISLV